MYTDPPFRNDAGIETDPTTVTVYVTDPTGITTPHTLASGDVVKTTTGQGLARPTAYPNGDFYYDQVTSGLGDQYLGVWIFTWVGTGNPAAAKKNTFQLDSEKTQ